MAQTIHVVGSLNMDFVVRVETLPQRGQTVSGRGFTMVPGGKGGNQACAVARLGGAARMIGRVGADLFGETLTQSLRRAGVDVANVVATPDEATGVALIPVESGGQNLIVVAAGANGRLTPRDVEAALAGQRGGLMLLQLESPRETVAAALALGRRAGATTILDPAPAGPLAGELLALVDVLTPNESEALVLLGEPGAEVTLAEAAAIARRLRALGPPTVILKLGAAGAWLETDGQSRHFPGRKVDAIDATAAGDTFNGALAVALAEGRELGAAIRFANAAAALSVTKLGAQASIPDRAAVEAFAPSPEER